VMLALRLVLTSGPPTMVFDEVDAGIGGQTARAVGERLGGLGAARQVLCITHLPQIAVYADSHFVIEKQVEQGRTVTSVRKLDRSGRVGELSRMLGGANITPQLRVTAEEMLREREESPENRAKAKGETTAKGESESPARSKAKTAKTASRRPEA